MVVRKVVLVLATLTISILLPFLVLVLVDGCYDANLIDSKTLNIGEYI
jgi:hypothetical protein